MGLRYEEQQGDGPLCPNSFAPEHKQVVRVQNALYSAVPRDEDGEIADYPAYQALEKTTLQEMGISSYMRLYSVESVLPMRDRQSIFVEAWFFQCPTCRFVLPANVIRRAL